MLPTVAEIRSLDEILGQIRGVEICVPERTYSVTFVETHVDGNEEVRYF